MISCQPRMQSIYYEGYPALLLMAGVNGEDIENSSDFISKRTNPGVNESFNLDLINSITQELKQPLHQLNCITGELLNTMLTNQQREFVEDVQICEKQMTRIIDNTFELHEIQSGNMKLLSQPLSLETLAMEAIEDSAAAVVNKHTELFYLIDDDVPQVVFGDKEHLKQILTNFLAIIIRFSGSGEVSLSIKKGLVESDKHHIIFEVHGASTSVENGFTKELREIISPSGLAADSEISNEDSGYTLAFQLITLMGGNLLVAENYGNSADLSFSLPMSVVVDEKEVDLNEFSALRHKKVLIVDDNSTLLCNLKSKLTSLGMEVTAASSGSEAINMLRNKIPLDLALIDYHLSGMSGEQLARKMQSLVRYEKLPKILVSSLPDFENVDTKVTPCRRYEQHYQS